MLLFIVSSFATLSLAIADRTCDPNGVVITATPHLTPPEQIASPQNGSTYPTNSLCRWYVYGQGPFWIWSDPYYLDIKGCDTNCSCGYIKFTKPNGEVIGKWCRELFDEIDDFDPYYKQLIYSEEPISIEFYSSNMNTDNARGFEIYHHTASDDCYDAEWQGLTPGEYRCKNNAYCYPNSEWYPLCRCRYGFYGDACQYKDRCVFNQCYNGGVCNRKQEGFSCSCPEGFTGERCENKL